MMGKTKKLDPIQKKNRVIRMARMTRRMVRIFAGFLALMFSFLKLKNFPFPLMTGDYFSLTFLQIAIVSYYLSWVFGVFFDTYDEEIVFEYPPNEGRIPLVAIVIAFFLTVTFGILCWVDTFTKFAIVLLTFWILNIIGWRYFVAGLMKSLLNENPNKNIWINERILIVKEYLCGKWQWVRFSLGFIIILFINIIAFTDIHLKIAERLTIFSPSSFLSFSILVFVFFVEGWMWFARLRRRSMIKILERLELNYTIKKRNEIKKSDNIEKLGDEIGDGT